LKRQLSRTPLVVILFTWGILWNGEDGRQIIVARKAQLAFLPGRKPNMVQKKNSDKKRTVTQMTRSQTFLPARSLWFPRFPQPQVPQGIREAEMVAKV
jgi:hypothetical protein